MLKLPQRSGEKPKTSPDQPHEQLDQNPPAEIYAKLKEQAFALPRVERRPSELSVPGAEAIWLSEESAHHRQEAFMFGGEFAHIHPPYDGSMHMTLSEEDVRELLDKGWGERCTRTSFEDKARGKRSWSSARGTRRSWT